MGIFTGVRSNLAGTSAHAKEKACARCRESRSEIGKKTERTMSTPGGVLVLITPLATLRRTPPSLSLDDSQHMIDG